MGTSVNSTLARFMATADSLIQLEATVNAPGAPTTTFQFVVANGKGSI